VTTSDAASESDLSSRSPARLFDAHAWMVDALALLWVAGTGVAVLIPALVHGASIVNPFSADQYDLFLPWATQAWTQVHHGHLPLWNPYSALGMPLAFNWESAPFGLPSIIGYLVPLHVAFTVQLIANLVIAGTGVYVLGRVLRLGALGCVMAATVYELSGPFVSLLGWSAGSVMSWAGWLFAATILVVRGRRRARCVTLFAVAFAFAIYAGEPEIVVILGLSLAIFLVVFLGLRAVLLGEAVIRPMVDIVLALAAGAGLAAPLVLPGLQVAGLSGRTSAGTQQSALANTAFPFHDIEGLILRGQWVYLGVVALALAVTGVGVRRRRPDVIAFATVAVVTAALAFTPLISLMRHVPKLGGVFWKWSTMPMVLAIAVLAGVGTDALVRSYGRRQVRYWAGGAYGAAAVILLALWGSVVATSAARAGIRLQDFIWPTLGVALGLATVWALARSHRRAAATTTHPRRNASVGRWGVVPLLVYETAFLVATGAPLWTSAPTLHPQHAVMLKRIVGSSVVGFGARRCDPYPRSLGILPNVNIASGVQELSVYDPMTPLAYFQGWRTPVSNTFCPVVTTLSMARRYGVGYVLEPKGAPGPNGAIFDTTLDYEDVYRIPSSAVATLTPAPSTTSLPGPDAPGVAVPVTHPDPASWEMKTSGTGPQILRLRLTGLPGWHAAIDGRPLRVETFSGIMLQARIPAGTHTIELHYWPNAFTAGLVLFASSGIGLTGALLVGRRRRRGSPA